MVNTIIGFSIRNKLLIGLLTLALVGAGIWSMRRMPVGAVPDITNNQVQVITVSKSLGPSEIEQYVTYPVEQAMSNLPGMKNIRSTSRFGLSVVTIIFEEDMGIYKPRQLVAEKLNILRKELPKGVGQPFMGPITTGLGEIYQYTIGVKPGYDTAYSLTELRTIQDWVIKRQMTGVEGVVGVNTFGGKLKQYEVAVNPEKLRAMGTSIGELFKALERNNANTGGAYIERQKQAQFIRGLGLVKNLESIRQIGIKTINGKPLTVGDVATVREGHAVRYGAATKNGQGETVGGIVMMLKGKNSSKVIARVKQRMEKIEQTLPEGLYIDTFLDRSDLIDRTTDTIKTNLIEGGLVVIFVLVLLLGNWRGGLIVASTIPLSLMFAFVLMNAFGVWANLMSLGAIDFGIIVDGAVIIVESTVFYLGQQKDRFWQNPRQVADETTASSASRMMNPAFFGQLIILLVFVPLLTLQGVEGKMFIPMAQTFGFAILGAMLLNFTYVPMMAALFLRPDKAEKRTWGGRIVEAIERAFAPFLRGALRRGWLVIGLAVALLGGAGWLFSAMGAQFIPQLDEGNWAMHLIMRPGTSLKETHQTTTKAEKLVLENFPEVEEIVSRMGTPETPTDAMPMDLADFYVMLKPEDQWTTGRTKAQLQKAIADSLEANLPGVDYKFSQPIEMRFNHLLSGVSQDLAVKLFGEDLEVLAQKAREMKRIMATVTGAKDLYVEATTGLPQMTVDFDRQQLAHYGLDIAQANRLIQTGFSCGKAGQVFEGQRRFDLVVRLDSNHRRSIQDLKNLYLPLPGSEKEIPLSQVADIGYEKGPMQISREGTYRRIFVGANVRGRDLGSVVEEIKRKFDQRLDLPAGYRVEYGGTYKNLERATNRLQIVVPVVLVVILLLTFLALRSLPQVLMIYMAIPMAAIGGVFGLYLRGMPFSISAGVGFIVLFGVAILNGLVLVNSFNELKAEGLPLHQRIQQGTLRRVRPIMLTALTDILGFLPMAISTSAGAEVQRPLATVVIGGLVTSTLLTLVVLPVLYQWVENWKGFNKPAVGSALVLGLALVPLVGQAQEPLSLEKTEQLTRRHFPTLKRYQKQTEQRQALEGTAWQAGRTQMVTGGPLNPDLGRELYTIFQLTQQNIDLFSGPARQKWLKAETQTAEWQEKTQQNQILAQSRAAWFRAVTAKHRLAIARRLNQLYKRYEQAAQMRYQEEATGKLAFLAARNQKQQAELDLKKARSQYRQSKAALSMYVGQDTSFTVPDSIPQRLWPDAFKADSAALVQHPLLRQSRQAAKAAKTKAKVQQKRLWPQLRFQYAYRKEPDFQRPFHQLQAGISIPLWRKPQKAKVKAAKRTAEAQSYALQERKRRLGQQFQQAQAALEEARSTWQYYREKALPLSREQIRAAETSYQEEAIDYLEYIQNMKEALRIQQEAPQSLLNYLLARNQLRYLMGHFTPNN